MTLLPRRARAGGILVFAAAATVLVVACANGTDPADLGPEPTVDGSPTSDVSSARDTSTNPGDSAMLTDAGKDTSTPTGSHVVINEFATDTEFCELYNPTSSSVSLAGWEVRYASAGGGAGLAGHKFGTSETIGPKSFLLLQNGTWTDGMAAGAGQLGLFNGTGTGATKIDGVGYGTVDTSGTLKYFEGPNAPSPPANGSIGRKVDGVDTDKNGADFTTFAVPTPGQPN